MDFNIRLRQRSAEKSETIAPMEHATSRKVKFAVAQTVLIIVALVFKSDVLLGITIVVSLSFAVSNFARFSTAILAGLLSVVVLSGLTMSWAYGFENSSLWIIGVMGFVSAWLPTFSSRQSCQKRIVKFRVEGIAILLPAVLTVVSLLIGGNIFGQNLGWMLTGDAQNNTVAVREIILHNGANPSYIPAPALTQLLMASAVAAKLGHVILASSFIPMIQTQAMVLAALWSATSVVFGLIAIREFRKSSTAARAIAGFIAASLPLSWFILGFSIDAGFYNTPTALLALGMAWVFWRELATLSRASQWIGISLLALTTLFAAMAWVPLALIPGLFFVAASVRTIWVDKNPHQLLKWPVLVSVGLLVLYSVTVILPSFVGHGDGLAGDGWMADLPKTTVVVSTLLTLLLVALIGVRFRKPGDKSFGLLIVMVGMSAGLAFLMASSLRNGAIWSYYPRKFAWMVVFFLMFAAAIVAITSPALRKLKPLWRRVVSVGAILALVLVGLLTVPFSQSGPLKVFPMLYVAAHGQDIDGAVPAIAETVGTKTIRLNYDTNDFIVNQWAFQWASHHNGTDSIWSFAYSLIKSPADVCAAAKTWDGGVTLLTKSQSDRDAVLAQCGELISEVNGL